MKKYLTLTFFFIAIWIFSQNNYDKDWREVYQFELDGQIQSAYEKVQHIYKKAKKKQEEVQIIKTFFYTSKFIQQLEEEAQLKIITNLTKELNEADEPIKSIYHFIFAQLLTDYLNENRYKIKNRTDTSDAVEDNFLFWSVSRLEREISNHYDYSRDNITLLNQKNILEYKDIFIISPDIDAKNYSLYAFLWNKCFEYFKKDVSQWQFNKSNLEPETIITLYAESALFTNLSTSKIINPDSKKIIELLVEYEKHATKDKPSIYLKRLNYIHSLVSDNSLYLQSLKQLEKNNKNTHLQQEIRICKAQYLYEITEKNTAENHYDEVLKLCDSVLQIKNNINALAEAERIKNRILNKDLTIEVKEILYNKEPSRAYLKYKNIDTITLHYFKIPKTFLNSNTKKKDSIIYDYISKNNPVTTFSRILPNPKKYFQFSTEVLLEPATIGDYLLIVQPNTQPLLKDNFEYTIFTVSNIAFVNDSDAKYDYFYASDRNSGKPLENIIVKNNEETQKTDAQGKASFKKKKFEKDKTNISLSPVYFINRKDTLISSYHKGWYFESNLEDDEEEDEEEFEAKAKVYFDRAIYRPGQKVYYKGILIQNKKNNKSIVPYVTVLVIIEDSDFNTLKEYEVQTNEFGSFTGEFELPKNCLTGQFTLTIDEPDHYENDKKYYNKKEDEHSFWDIVDFDYDNEFSFQVEEYKRPTFEVVFDEIKENYTLGDTLKIKGNAKTLAGSNLTNVNVKYTITKNVYTEDYNTNSNRDNTIGQVTTDGNGNFIISIVANDSILTSDRIEKIIFNIDVEVIDSNGETRVAKKSVVVGKKMLQLQLYLNKGQLYKEDTNSVSIQATTLNNYTINAKGTLYISYLAKQKYFKERQFPTPEIQTISKKEFEVLFPNEPYQEKDLNIEEKVVKIIPFDTKENKKVALDFLNELENGNYKIVAKALDANKNEINTSTYFELNSRKNNFDESVLFTFKDITDPLSDYFEFEFQSIIPNLFIFSRFYVGENLNQEQVIALKNNKGFLKIKKEKISNNQADFYFHFSTHYDNITFVKTYAIPKELVDKKLDFEIISLRNKIEPNSNESWSFKIRNTQLETEVLASMYDSSLDQFKMGDWDTYLNFGREYNAPNYPSFYKKDTKSIYFNKFYQNYQYYKYYIKNPELNQFGFHFTTSYSKNSNKKYLETVEPLVTIPKNATYLTGNIKDALGPLAGATVTVQGTRRGTTSDFDGNFSIAAEPGEILTISYIGMIDSYYTVKKKNDNITITLENDETDLKEVVVVGYGTITKEAFTSAVTVIHDTIPQDSKFLSYLSGVVAGVEVQENPGSATTIRIRGFGSVTNTKGPLYIVDGVPVTAEEFSKLTVGDIGNYTLLKDASATALYGSSAAGGAIIVTTKKALKEVTQVKTRTNFNETAIFYPELKTDKEGKISFDFTTPESLTRWKLRLLGHTKNFETGYFQTDIVSQKELMVMPNSPRFVREKDTITLVSKVVNLTHETKSGIAMLLLFDATNGKAVDSISLNLNNQKNFSCKPKESVAVSWTITIPEQLQGLQYKIVAQSGNHSDGEENILPVLSNKIAITETIPLWVRENSKKEYVLENLKTNTSPTLQNYSFTLEYTSNPVWLAVQALPYLIEFEHECAEQTFARYYANAIAAEIITKNPKIATLFESYRKEKKPEVKLKMNEALKSILLAETPWFFDSENETVKKQQLALLFDIRSLEENRETTLQKLNDKVLNTGGFSWFDGGEVNLFITQHILAGIGHMNQLFPDYKSNHNTIVSKSIPFVDYQFLERFETNKIQFKNYSFTDIHYLYTRSFFLNDFPLNAKLNSMIQFQLEEVKQNWLNYSLYQKGQLALIYHRFGDTNMAKKILKNLKETASLNDEIGMYWIENSGSWYWYQSQIETQALLVEAFNEIAQDKKSIDLMKVWLLKNKQNKNWNNTKATTEAIYALLLQGTNWTSVKDKAIIKIGNKKIATKKLSEQEKEAETGYFKLNWKEDDISNEMANISIENQSEVPSFGGIYWQYFEDLEAIQESSNNVLQITKKLFKKENTKTGPILSNIEQENLKIGDIVTIRLYLKVTEDLEFVHLKDLRASCFEPLDVLSKHEWKENLHYYKSTKDVATHFFFDRIYKGNYSIEYDVRINYSGNFNDGIATIQSMYAPEFSAHSKNNKVNITK